MNLITLFLAVAPVLAMPLDGLKNGEGEYAPLCPAGLTNATPQCCKTNELGLASTDCKTPPNSPINPEQFRAACSAEDRNAQCCTLPLLGLGVVCQDSI